MFSPFSNKVRPPACNSVKMSYKGDSDTGFFPVKFAKFLKTPFLFSNNLKVWSIKHSNCLGRSIMPGNVNIDNKINLAFYN